MSSDDSTFIRRTVIERGVRTAGGGDYATGGRVAVEAMRVFHHQHEEEKREMQDLNLKFRDYLARVKALETQNHQLQLQLDELKQKWGFDSGKIKDQYDAALIELRRQIDLATQQKTSAELDAKRTEYNVASLRHQADFANELINLDRNRFAMLKQQLEGSGSELVLMRSRFEERKGEIDRNRGEVARLYAQLEDLKNQFDNESMLRVKIQNEIQTLEEQLAFMKAVHEEERNELASLGTLSIDVTQFYRSELTRAIAEIKGDFEMLASAQRRELEEYYRIKTEEILVLAAEQKRKHDEASRMGAVESMDLSTLKTSLTEHRDAFATLQKEHSELTHQLRTLEEEWQKLLSEQHQSQIERERELAELRAQAEAREQAIAAILENNVSLRFEINTYRRLLDVQIVNIERFDYGAADVQTKKMSVQKSAKGTVTIDQVDPQGNFIVIENSGSSGKSQEMKGWTIRRKVDSKDEIVYKFPDNFVLAARSRVRILARSASRGSISDREVLTADGVQTWGTGTNMLTRLMDADGAEKASLNQKFQQ